MRRLLATMFLAPCSVLAHPGHDPVSFGSFHWMGHLLSGVDPVVVIVTIGIGAGLLCAGVSRARKRPDDDSPTPR